MQMFHLNATFYPGHHHGFMATIVLGHTHAPIHIHPGTRLYRQPSLRFFQYFLFSKFLNLKPVVTREATSRQCF